jgi:CubicO group peptidase (beta-lactamase class C family)
VQSLFDATLLEPGSLAYPTLGFSHPADSRSDDITVQELIDHTAGYDDTGPSGFDPTYNMGQIAQSLGVSTLTKLDIAKYMYGQSLQYKPGAPPSGEAYVYSNYGYLLLAVLVEKITGQDYFAYLKSKLLDPAGITEVKVISTSAAGRTGDEAIAEDPALGPNPFDPGSTLPIPAVYGGDGEINELGVGNDGLGASARAMAQFAHLHAVWGNGARAPGSARSGSTPGASTYVWSRGDGIDAAFTINTRTWPPGSPDKLVDNFQKQIDGLL